MKSVESVVGVKREREEVCACGTRAKCDKVGRKREGE